MDHCSYPADSVRKLHQVSVRTDLFISVLCWFTVPYNRWTDCEDHRCWRLVTLDVTNRHIWLWNWTRLLFETKRNQNLLNGFDVWRRFKPARQKTFLFLFSVVSTNQRKPGRKVKTLQTHWKQMSSDEVRKATFKFDVSLNIKEQFWRNKPSFISADIKRQDLDPGKASGIRKNWAYKQNQQSLSYL